jgi:hypothetical protein
MGRGGVVGYWAGAAGQCDQRTMKVFSGLWHVLWLLWFVQLIGLV